MKDLDKHKIVEGVAKSKAIRSGIFRVSMCKTTVTAFAKTERYIEKEQPREKVVTTV